MKTLQIVFGSMLFLSALIVLFPQQVTARNLIVSVRNGPGNRLTVQPDQTLAFGSSRAAEITRFVLLDLDDGELEDGDPVAFKSIAGKFVAAIDGGGGKLVADRDVPGQWETFKIERLTRRDENKLILDGDRIAIYSMRGTLVSVSGGSGEANAIPRSRGTAETFVINLFGNPLNGSLSGPFTAPQMIIRPVVGMDESGKTSGDVNLCRNGFFGDNFPNCYRGHEGTDFLLAGHLLAQAAGSIDIYTVASGRVVAVGDGNTDKCFFRPAKPDSKSTDFVFCANDVRDGRNFISDVQDANFVTVLQDDGVIAYYYHLKRGSVSVRVGQRVECGHLVGKVGSSGISSVPHLHLTLLRVKNDRTFPANEIEFKDMGGTRDAVDYINPYSPNLWRELIGAVPKKTCLNYNDDSGPRCSLGQPCPSNVCQVGLFMKDGVCKRVGVLPGKPCDGNQLCGRGLECTQGSCRVPPPKKPNIRLP